MAIHMAPSLVEGLRVQSALHPDRLAFHIYDRTGTLTTLTYAGLLRGATDAAEAMRRAGVRAGDHVCVCLDTSPELLFAIFGCLLLDARPVLLEPPLTAGRAALWPQRLHHAATLTSARLAIMPAHPSRAADYDISIDVLAPPFLPVGAELPAIDPSPDKVAFAQLSSGTTGDAKATVISHRALAANAAAVAKALPYRTDDIVVSWLPLHHDMGLFLMMCFPFLHGLPIVLMSPLLFAFAPRRWLVAIDRHRATITAAPNFALSMCADKISNESLVGIDLQSCRVLMVAAEFIQAGTLRRWQEKMGPLGFAANAIRPGYGMAEFTVGATVSPVNEPYRTIHRPAAFGHAYEVVSVGAPLPGTAVKIVDDNGEPVAEGTEGHILLAGPSMMDGYLGQPEATAAAITDGWLKSGDLGLIDNGELFITGRSKDIIIKSGRNFHPHSFESAAASIKGVRLAAAVGYPDPQLGSEALAVIVETAVRDVKARRELRDSVEQAVTVSTGLRPDAVIITGLRTLPKSTSGKLRRSEIVRRLLAGEISEAPTRPATAPV